MRRLVLPTVLVCALVASTGALGAPVFFVDGRGWGHGIGMPQYGAQGYASREGRSHAWILAHYFPGTRLGSTPVSAVRVLLADDRRTLTVGSAARFTATDAAGRRYELPAGSLELGPALRVTVEGEPRTLASPVRFEPGGRHLELGGRPYRGDVVVRSTGGTLAAVNHVGLEAYLYGVVPDEMPPSWAIEALKAQAVAARSYAVVSRRTGGTFDVFADTRSQVYGGVASEEPRTNAAIDATSGQVLLHGDRVAWTFFHSTSGGRTAAIHDVWNASPVPYLVSVPDPYDSLSPYHVWGPYRFTASDMKSRLGSLAPAGSLLDLTVKRNGSQRVDSVLANGSRADTRFSGSTFQSRLGLRSSWFSIAVLSLAGGSRVEHGGRVTLRGIARGVRVASLEARPPGGRWQRVARLRRAADGAFRAVARPTVTTSYRIASPKGVGAEHRVTVAPWIRFSGLREAGTLTGLVRPRIAGAVVTVQRRQNGGWVTVARARTDGNGRFRATFAVTPGTYRGIVRVGPGYATGRTPTLRVVSG